MGSFLLAAGLLVGCTGADDNNSGVGGDRHAIRISADTRQIKDGSRAITIYEDDAALVTEGDVLVDAYFNDTNTKFIDGVKLHYTGGDPTWTFWDGSAALHYYWPIEGSVYDPASANIPVTSLDFVGFCPYAKPSYVTTGPSYNYSSTGVSFTCTMSSLMTAASQEGSSEKEFMFAKALNQTYATQTAAGGAIPLQFQHPFATVVLKWAETADKTGITISKVSLRNIKAIGTYAENTNPKWTTSGDDTNFDATGLQNYDATSKKYLVIPQSFGGTIEVTATGVLWDNPTVERTLSTTVPTTWQPGYCYTYFFTISKDFIRVEVEGKFTEQW